MLPSPPSEERQTPPWSIPFADSPVADFNAELWPIPWVSLRVSGTAVLLASVVGIPLGAWAGLTPFRGRGIVTACVHTGMALPPVVVGLAVYLLLSRSGPLGFLDWLFTPQAMTLAQTVLALPPVTAITLSSVAAVPAELPLQLRALGASRWQARRGGPREARAGVLVA